MGEKMKLKIILSYILVIISGILLFSGAIVIEDKILNYFYHTSHYWFIVTCIISIIILITIFYGTLFLCSIVEDVFDNE